MKHFIVLLAVCVSGCAAQGWKPRNTVMEIVGQALNLEDARQTAQIKSTPDIQEDNPITASIIGRQPSRSSVNRFFLATGVASYFIARRLPPKWREAFQGFHIYAAGVTVSNNCDLGLESRFCP